MKNKIPFLLGITLVLCFNVSFTAKAAAPTVQASNVVITNLSATSATISWTRGNGANCVVSLENPSGRAAAPVNGITYIASTDWNSKGSSIDNSNYYCIYNGSGNSVTVTNLSSTEKFTVRISEYNGTGISTEYLTDINGVLDNPYVFFIPPSIQAKNIIISNLTSTSATISWTNGNGTSRTVFVENPSGTAAAPYNKTNYTASSDWSSKGDRIGSSNYYCVYNGTGNSVGITNLSPNSKYSVRISEYNGTFELEQYLTDINNSVDNPYVFNTLATDIPANELPVEVSVSPNPTPGIITVTSGLEVKEAMTVTISNLVGKTITKVSTDKSTLEINLSAENSGIYILSVDIDGKTTICKVVKN